MTSEELSALIEETFVQILAQRVVEKLIQRRKDALKDALVVFTGSNIGVPPMLECMGQLRKEGFKFHVLLSRSAARLYNPEEIKKVLEPEDLWIDEPPQTPEALTKIYDTVIVPAMTVHTASHIAMCMADTPASAIILDGLMRGKNVIINIDGCCPDNAERPKRGFAMTEPLKQVLRDHLKAMKSFGAKLTNSRGLYRKTMISVGETVGAPAPAKAAAPAPAKASPAKNTAANEVRIAMGGKIFASGYLKGIPAGTTVRIPSDAKVTLMAADEARYRGITIVKD